MMPEYENHFYSFNPASFTSGFEMRINNDININEQIFSTETTLNKNDKIKEAFQKKINEYKNTSGDPIKSLIASEMIRNIKEIYKEIIGGELIDN